MKKYFGTDGIRGRANTFPMTPEVALLLGKAAGAYFRNGNHRHMVVVGKDTRLSGYMLEYALIAGFTSAGMDVRSVGPLPTPAIGMLTRALRADLGVMITASHNQYTDNGIKLFGPDGFKLPDHAELEIERLMGNPKGHLAATPVEIGQVAIYQDAKGRYVEAAKAAFPRDLKLEGVKIVLDCANGAGYRVAPQALWELGANVDAMGVAPNGENINLDCGSTHPESLASRVVETGADIGLALDGDADRLIVCDEKGNIIDGDQLISRIATDRFADGVLAGGGAVATVMSNFAMDRYFSDVGMTLSRTNVGDRYVVERMREQGFSVGGEQSGHIVLTDHATTGDGLIAALQILSACVRQQKPVSEMCSLFEPAPQIKINVGYEGASPLEAERVQAVIAEVTQRLNGHGRLLVRPSGTEPVIRVLAEGDDLALIETAADDIVNSLKSVSQTPKTA
jgi:phosphoglucosamine mutase